MSTPNTEEAAAAALPEHGPLDPVDLSLLLPNSINCSEGTVEGVLVFYTPAGHQPQK